MPKVADDAAYLARLQDYFARWRSLPAYEPLQAVLGLASRSAVAKVLHRLQGAGFVERTPDGRWTPTGRFFERPHAECPVPAGVPLATADSGDVRSIDAWLVRYPSRTVLIPITGDSMIEAGIHPGDVAVVERDAPARPGDAVIAVIDNEMNDPAASCGVSKARWYAASCGEWTRRDSLSRPWRSRTAKPCCSLPIPLIPSYALATACRSLESWWA